MFSLLILALFLFFGMWVNILTNKTWPPSIYLFWFAIALLLLFTYARLSLTWIILTEKEVVYKSPFQKYQIPLERVQLIELVEEKGQFRFFRTNIYIGIAATPELQLRRDSLLSTCFNSSTQFFLMYEPQTWEKLQSAIRALNPELVVRGIGC